MTFTRTDLLARFEEIKEHSADITLKFFCLFVSPKHKEIAKEQGLTRKEHLDKYVINELAKGSTIQECTQKFISDHMSDIWVDTELFKIMQEYIAFTDEEMEYKNTFTAVAWGLMLDEGVLLWQEWLE